MVLLCLLHHPINFGQTTSLLTTIIRLIVDSTHSSAFFNETLNSSMMFSSLLTVVQSSEPHCLQCLAWAALTTSSSASQPHLQFYVADFRIHALLQPSSVPFQAPFGAVHLTILPSGHELSTSLTNVYTRHFDTGQSSCPRLRGLVPSARIVSPCFARSRFQLGLSSRAAQDSTKRV